MKRTILLLYIALAAIAVNAQTQKLENKGGRYVYAGETVCKKSDKATFGAVVLWALEQKITGIAGNEKSAVEEYDINKMTIKLKPTASRDEESENYYTFQLSLRVGNGKLEYLIEKAKAMPKKIFGALAPISLDKINLVKKPQNKVYIDEFATICDSYASKMIDSIINKDVNLTNWEHIVKGQVVKGMDENEVKMAIGMPERTTENSQRIIWNYASGKIVMFENGLVSGTVN